MSLLNFPEKPDVSAMSFVPEMDKPSSTIAENIAAGFKQGRALAPLNSRLYERNWWTDTINQIADQTGQNYFQKFTNPAYTFQTGTYEYFYHANNIRNFVKKNQKTLKLGDPAEQTNLNMLLLDKDEFARQISKQAKENALADVEEANQIYEQSNTNVAKAGFFVGELGAGFTDPLNLGLAVTTGPLGVGRTLASVMLREALINMSAEAIQAPAVADWYKTLGLDYGFEEFRNSLIAAGTFGAAFPLAIRAGEKAVSLTVDQLRKGADVIFDGGTAKSDAAQGAEFTLDVLDADAVENPLDGPKADIEHVKRLEAAQSAIIDATAPNITEQPGSAIRAPNTLYDGDNLDNQVFRFDPDEILVDAKLFQFKEGGDQFGVTSRLQGVTKWDPGKAGQIVVYEFSDGRQFIADGHQRLGLAKRIKSEDPSQDVRLYGRKIKEVDGITPDEAVVIAAMKNIAEGTGTKTDAAKVFRIAPDKVNDPSFPKTGAFIQQARSLSNLSNESFGLIKNGIVSEEFGALVGRLVPDDPDMQLAALNVLARVDPSNVFQADTIVRQVMESGVTKETQESLFGDEAIVESLFLERARVLDQAVKKLKKDKSAFNNITSNAAKLEGEGNKLATDANRKRVQTDGEAIAIIQSQANKKGFLSDALSDAARFARQSGNYGQASNSFVEAVRRSIDQGDFRRAETGDVRRFVNDQTQEFAARNEPAQDQLDKFDNPHSDAVIAQGDAMVEDIKADAQQSRDLFDQGQASQAGNRQMDLEELIDEAKDPSSARLINLTQLAPKRRGEIEDNFKQAQNLKSLDDAFIRAEKNHSDLDKAVETIASDIKAVQTKAKLKGRSRAEIKLQDKYEGNVNRLTDLARTGIEVDTPQKADEFVQRLSDKFRVLDEGYNVQDTGYFDRKLTVIFNDGQLGEVQIFSKTMSAAKKNGGHNLYKIIRDQTKSEAERKTAFAQSVELYGKARADLSADWQKVIGQTPSGIEPPKPSVTSVTTSLETSGDPISSRTSDATILPQPDDAGLRRSNIDLSASSIAGMDPSTRKNLIDDLSDDLDIDTFRSEINQDDLFPVGFVEGPDGQPTARLATAKQLLDEIDQDDAMIDRLSRCPI